jgi:Ca2+-binding EF-hand superfamily protein
MILLAGSMLADEKDKKDKDTNKPRNATIAKVDAKNGTITLKFTDDQGKTQEKTFQLTSDVRLLDDTGRVVKIDVFESGHEALVIESAGHLRELRRSPHVGGTRRLSDAVRTLIEMSDCEESCTEDLQKIYDMLRKLDTGKNGKIDPQALKAEADNIVRERVKKVFDRLDTNKDGKISKEEARGLIKEHFDRIDTNKDGFIEFNELLKAAKERREHERAAGRPSDNKSTQKEKK